MPKDFTLESYRNLMGALRDRGYTARGYEDADPAAKHVILRHDLDMSLQAAEPVADIEHELGLRAHYFVLLRTEMYNPFSARARASLDRIRGHGHEIGLHLDAALYEDDPKALDAAAARECRALEDAIGAPVRSVSFHRPAQTLLGYDGPLAGRRHAYEPRYFGAMGYCSDSQGSWRNGHPLAHEAVGTGRALQLLTHPIWWVGPAAAPQMRLDRFLAERCTDLDRHLADNCRVHRPGRRLEIGRTT